MTSGLSLTGRANSLASYHYLCSVLHTFTPGTIGTSSLGGISGHFVLRASSAMCLRLVRKIGSSGHYYTCMQPCALTSSTDPIIVGLRHIALFWRRLHPSRSCLRLEERKYGFISRQHQAGAEVSCRIPRYYCAAGCHNPCSAQQDAVSTGQIKLR